MGSSRVKFTKGRSIDFSMIFQIKYEQHNQLEVTVSKMSSEQSVNNAERLTDYWVLGGIYRPVYLTITPKEHVAWTDLVFGRYVEGKYTYRLTLYLLVGKKRYSV